MGLVDLLAALRMVMYEHGMQLGFIAVPCSDTKLLSNHACIFYI